MNFKKNKLTKFFVYGIVVCFLAFCFYLPTQKVAIAASQGSIIASTLYVREGAGTNYDVLLNNGSKVALQKGAKVTIISKKNDWYFISFLYNKTTVKGYVLSTYVKVDAAATPTPSPTKAPSKATGTSANLSGKATVNKLNVRTKASKTAAPLTVSGVNVALATNQQVTIISTKTVNNEKWYYISFQYKKVKQYGYVLGSYIKISYPSGTVTTANLNVRVNAGTDKNPCIYNSKPVKLAQGQKVTVLSSTKVKDDVWYKISFSIGKTTLKGYVSSDYIKVTGGAVPSASTPTPSKTPVPSKTPTPSKTPVPSKTPTPSKTPVPSSTPIPSKTPTPTKTPVPSITPTTTSTPQVSPGPLSDSQFEQELVTEGFPESYKPYLRSLHTQYPYWQFTAFQTGLDWNSVIAAENVVGKNLLPNSKTIAWKSIDPKAYNWSTDKFVPYDGSTWVTASKQAMEYYMDPRNFLTPRSVFQFESLEYRSNYQTQSGVEKILMSTPLYSTTYSYLDDATGSQMVKSYAQTFINAAEYSGVSPYHLASRSKQEIVTGATTLSSVVSGKVSGYEGYYNFYNIGAYNSTAAGGALTNALKYAMNGTTSASNNALYLIPWNNPYKAIVGGGKFIGNTYINKGQNTGYLQKFNVTTYSQFNHQYMANIEAANAEAGKTFNAYSSLMDIPIVFSIPVYQNMPMTPCSVPSGGLNPNNWLKSLSVENNPLTPTFKITDAGSVEYTVIVDNTVTSVNINAAPVSTTATVGGTGLINLTVGTNRVVIPVTAQNGDVKNYTVNIIRNAP